MRVNPSGEKDPRKRCKHVSFVGKTLVSDEEEYLFTAYSIFTVRKVTWGKDGARHYIELDAASDNNERLDTGAASGGGGRWATPAGSENLELAPWI